MRLLLPGPIAWVTIFLGTAKTIALLYITSYVVAVIDIAYVYADKYKALSPLI